MRALCLASVALAVLASGPVRATQLPADDALACLLPVFDIESQPQIDGKGDGKSDGKVDKIDPKAAEAAAKRKLKWWRNEELCSKAAITEAQSTELDRIFHTFYASLKSGTDDVERYHKDVSKMMAEGSSSEVDVLHAIDKLEAAKASLARTRMLMLYRMYRVLTPEQREKVKKFQEQQAAAATAPR
jgi:Spy/CpxP family protein refolding chaperone